MTQPAPTHQVAPPPQQSQLVRDIAIILAAGLSIAAMAEGIELLLVPYAISKSVIMAAVGLAQQGSTHTPRPRMKAHGVDPRSTEAAIPRAAANDDLYYRAAFVLNSARRMQERLRAGGTLRESISEEARFYRMHETARRGRLDAAAKVAHAAAQHGDLLGWYLDYDLNNEAECIAASGNNFYAEDGTVIGLPGAVHPRCGCTAGPPHPFGGMVNDAVRGVITHIGTAQMFKLKRVRKAS